MFGRKQETDVVTSAAVCAAGAAGYVTVVAAAIWNAAAIFGTRPVGFMGPLTFLMMFVFSAAVMALLFFGRPVLLYLDGKKKDAVRHLLWTVGFFGAATVVALFVLAVVA